MISGSPRRRHRVPTEHARHFDLDPRNLDVTAHRCPKDELGQRRWPPNADGRSPDATWTESPRLEILRINLFRVAGLDYRSCPLGDVEAALVLT